MAVNKPLHKPFWDIVLYFLYPKKKDFQKSFLIVLGFLAGVWMGGQNAPISWIIKNMFFCWLFQDFFVYQARYLWNDIRGMNEDFLAGKTDRLPVKELGAKKAVIISTVVIFSRLVSALIFIQHLDEKICKVFLANFSVILIISVVYEIARTKKWNFAVFILVSLGYPIRVFTGFWTAFPREWSAPLFWDGQEISHIIFVLFFLMYTCVGELSAILMRMPYRLSSIC